MGPTRLVLKAAPSGSPYSGGSLLVLVGSSQDKLGNGVFIERHLHVWEKRGIPHPLPALSILQDPQPLALPDTTFTLLMRKVKTQRRIVTEQMKKMAKYFVASSSLCSGISLGFCGFAAY